MENYEEKLVKQAQKRFCETWNQVEKMEAIVFGMSKTGSLSERIERIARQARIIIPPINGFSKKSAYLYKIISQRRCDSGSPF